MIQAAPQSRSTGNSSVNTLGRLRPQSKRASEQRKNVHLFLRDVSHIDETGHSLLSRLAAQGVELSAAGLYSSYVINQIQRALSCRESPGK